MTADLLLRGKRCLGRARWKMWTKVLGYESWVRHHGKFRERERYDLISRPNYAYGMLRAADIAKYFGKQSATVVEFGVAGGAGLLNMLAIAPAIEKETGIQLRIFGFDTGRGLPSIEGYKDHPEIWSPGDFPTQDRDRLTHAVKGRAEIIWGDIGETVQAFTESIDPLAPLGFISVDVDIYTATAKALQCLKGPSEKYAPAVAMYFDDTAFYFANRWSGELAAIDEFNEQHELRKIDLDRTLPGSRPNRSETWHGQMYICHVLDHPARQKPRRRNELTIESHAKFLASSHIHGN